jgi:hypothetical protein
MLIVIADTEIARAQLVDSESVHHEPPTTAAMGSSR